MVLSSTRSIGLDTDKGVPDLSVVIVNWNAKEFLEGCLQSIFSSNGKLSLEVLVVDNASEDGSAAMVKRLFPAVQVISNGSNRGFAKANNQGILRSKGRHVLLLNPDTAVLPGAFEILLDFLEENPSVGAVGPRMYGPRGETLESFSHFPGLRLLIRGISIVITGQYYRDERPKSLEPRQVDWVGGACLLVRRQALEEIGLLDEKFFMYWEEADLCLRLKRRNWKTCYVPESEVIHYLGRSAAKAEDQVLIHGILLQAWGRSAQWFIKKHYPVWVSLLFRATVLGFTAVSLLPWAILWLLPPKRAKASEILRAYALSLGLIHREEELEPDDSSAEPSLHNVPRYRMRRALGASDDGGAGDF